MLTLISFIFVFNVIVFIHELGHFLLARKNNILVHEFSLGMGPAIFKKEKNGILYSLRAFPIGGYVKMEGEDENSDHKDSFSNKSAFKRFLVVAAGPVFNFILTFVLFAVIGIYMGMPTLTLDNVNEKYPAYKAGVRDGDIIRKINSYNIYIFDQIISKVNSTDEKINIEVKRDNKILKFEIEATKDKYGRKIIGVGRKVTHNAFYSIPYSFKKMWFLTSQMGDFFQRLFQGKASSDDISGPVGIVKIVGDVAKTGFINVIALMAYLSLNLGIINLLPLPALDGGRLVFIIIEMIRGKPIDQKKEGYVHMIGFILLLVLLVFVTYKDIVRMF